MSECLSTFGKRTRSTPPCSCITDPITSKQPNRSRIHTRSLSVQIRARSYKSTAKVLALPMLKRNATVGFSARRVTIDDSPHIEEHFQKRVVSVPSPGSSCEVRFSLYIWLVQMSPSANRRFRTSRPSPLQSLRYMHSQDLTSLVQPEILLVHGYGRRGTFLEYTP